MTYQTALVYRSTSYGLRGAAVLMGHVVKVVVFPQDREPGVATTGESCYAGASDQGIAHLITTDAVFVATRSMLPVGTSVTLGMLRENEPAEWRTVKGVVTYSCPVTDEFGFSSGLGVRITEGDQVLKDFMS